MKDKERIEIKYYDQDFEKYQNAIIPIKNINYIAYRMKENNKGNFVEYDIKDFKLCTEILYYGERYYKEELNHKELFEILKSKLLEYENIIFYKDVFGDEELVNLNNFIYYVKKKDKDKNVILLFYENSIFKTIYEDSDNYKKVCDYLEIDNE